MINIFFTFDDAGKNPSEMGEESSLNTRKLTENLVNIVKSDLKDVKPTQSVAKQKPVPKQFPSRPWYLSV